MSCNCTITQGNTGVTSCLEVLDSGARLFLVRTRNNAGALNSILSSDTVDDTFISGKVNADPSERWYPLPNHKRNVNARAEANMEEIDGINYFVSDGVRDFSGELIGGFSHPVLQGKIESFRCGEYSVFIVSRSGQISGYDPTGLGAVLLPYPIERNTLRTLRVEASKTDNTTSKLMVMFSLSDSFKDSQIAWIPSSDVDSSILTINGLLDLTLTFTVTATTTATVQVDTSYGSAFDKTPVLGLLVGNFALYNSTTSTSVAVTVADNGEGLYTLTFLAQVAAQVAQLTVSGTGYEAKVAAGAFL